MPLRRNLFYVTGLSAMMVAACSQPSPDTAAAEAAAPQDAAGAASSLSGGEGEGGEGGEGSGGEMGVDPDAAREQMSVYLTAIEVMRAHYIAGLAALDNGDRAAASALFSHPISEIYIDFEPVIEARGGELMGETMNAAAVLHFQGAETAEIRGAVEQVLAALDRNAERAPAPQGTAEAAHAEVLVDLIERAALMYPLVQAAPGGDAWLDGYGYARAAERYQARHGDALASADADAAAVVAGALAEVLAAYPSAEQPEPLPGDAAAMRSASNAAREAISVY